MSVTRCHYIIAILTAVISLSGSGTVGSDLESSAGADRPEFLGFSVAYPTTIPTYVSQGKILRPHDLRYGRLSLDIDSTGRCISVSAESESDSVWLEYVDFYLQAITFEPATQDSTKVGSILPVRLLLRRNSKRPFFVFPVDTARLIADLPLYRSAYLSNGIQLSGISSFPGYAGGKIRVDTNLFPYAIIRLALDEKGKPVEIEPVNGNMPMIAMLLHSSALWGEYNPATRNGKTVPTEAFLAIALYPAMDYPLRRWVAQDRDGMLPANRARVRLVPTETRLIFPAVPRIRPGTSIVYAKRGLTKYDSLNCYLTVDTLGHCRIRPEGRNPARYREFLDLVEGRLRFYPALDIDGRPQRFSGFISLYPDGSAIIRISYHWLERY